MDLMQSSRAPGSGQQVDIEVALDTMPAVHLMQVLKADPMVVQKKFWHGLTCLHKLCLRTDESLEALQFCIESGADVNAKNNFDETPIMFAAKKGSIRMIKLFIDSGGLLCKKAGVYILADKDMVDKAGRSLFHHAVMGGSVLAVHFLHLALGFAFNLVDQRQQNAVHIAACQSNLDMVLYFMKFNRVNIMKQDVFGNTPMHTAATYGNVQMVWEMITYAGTDILTVTNQKNQCPVDCCNCQGFRQKDTVTLLSYADSERKRGRKYIPGPSVLWVWYMFMPLVIFLAGLPIAAIIQNYFEGYSGSLTMLPVLAYILNLFRIHTHRMKHYTKWPNPMHAGAFFSAGISTMVLWSIVMLPSIPEHTVLIMFCVTIGTVALYLYYKLLTVNPGYSPKPTAESSEDPKLVTELLKMPTLDRFCIKCERIRLATIKHCKLCDRCVSNMDHHCLFLMRCIAQGNHRLFVFFVTLVDIFIILFLWSSYYYAFQMYPSLGWKQVLHSMVSNHIFTSYMIIMNMFSLPWGLELLRWQLRFIASGSTYYESLNNEIQATKLSLRDKLINLIYFTKGFTTPYRRGVHCV